MANNFAKEFLSFYWILFEDFFIYDADDDNNGDEFYFKWLKRVRHFT